MIPAIIDARRRLAALPAADTAMICLTATGLPLLAMLAGTVFALPLLPVLAVAALAGFVCALIGVSRLVRPLDGLMTTLQTYRDNETIAPVYSGRSDRVGVAVDGVCELLLELDQTIAQLRRQAMTDVLTGLGNRRWLIELGTMQIARAAREAIPVSLIIFDLDHFKSINDEFGHDVGDQALMMAGMTIQHNLRPYDIAARIGGEEFCVLLPGTTGVQATAIANRLRGELAIKAVGPLVAGRVTASFGVYQGDPVTESLVAMLKAADEQLYGAKGAGRNIVRSAECPSTMGRAVTG